MAALVQSPVTLTLRNGAAFRQKRATRKAGVVVRASNTKTPFKEDDTGSSRRHILSASLAAAVAVRPCSSPSPSHISCVLFIFFAWALNLPRESTFSYRRGAYLSRQRLLSLPLRSLQWRRAKTSRTPRTSETVSGPARPFMNCNFTQLFSPVPSVSTPSHL